MPTYGASKAGVHAYGVHGQISSMTSSRKPSKGSAAGLICSVHSDDSALPPEGHVEARRRTVIALAKAALDGTGTARPARSTDWSPTSDSRAGTSEVG